MCVGDPVLDAVKWTLLNVNTVKVSWLHINLELSVLPLVAAQTLTKQNYRGSVEILFTTILQFSAFSGNDTGIITATLQTRQKPGHNVQVNVDLSAPSDRNRFKCRIAPRDCVDLRNQIRCMCHAVFSCTTSSPRTDVFQAHPIWSCIFLLEIRLWLFKPNNPMLFP